MKKIAYWLTICLIFTIPFKEIFVLPQLGTISRILGVVVAAAWLVSVGLTGQIRRPGIFHLAAFTFFTWNFLSILWSINADQSLARSLTFARMAIFVWLIWDLFNDRGAIWIGCQAYVLGAWVTIGSLMSNFINGVEAYHSSGGRFTATGFNTNETGIILGLGIPLAWFLATSNPLQERMPTLIRWVNFLYIPAALFAIVLTASRGSMLAAAPGLLVILISLKRTSTIQRVVLATGLIATAISFNSIVPQENLERLNTAGEEISANDLNGRVHIWKQGFEVFEENVIAGIGTGAFRSAIQSGIAPHNVFVAIAVELGLIGITLFCLILLIVFAALWMQPAAERLIWASLLLNWLLGSMVGNWEYENVSWLFLCFIVRVAALHSLKQHLPRSSYSPVTSSKVNSIFDGKAVLSSGQLD